MKNEKRTGEWKNRANACLAHKHVSAITHTEGLLTRPPTG